MIFLNNEVSSGNEQSHKHLQKCSPLQCSRRIESLRVHLTVRAIFAASHVNHPLVPVRLKAAKKLQLFLLNTGQNTAYITVKIRH